MIKYRCALLAVKDIEISKRFYQELFGLTIAEDYGINIAFEGGLGLQQEFDWLTGLPRESVVYESHSMELYFETEDLDAFLQKLHARGDVRFVHGLKTHAWQQRVVRVYDPDGHILEIGEPFPCVIRRLLSQGMSEQAVAEITQQTVAYVQKVREEADGSV